MLIRVCVVRTGVKCLPASKVSSARGNGLHDWHAEVLAIRAFQHVLLHECRCTSTDVAGWSSRVVRRRSLEDDDKTGKGEFQQPFAWREGVSPHSYCSEAPCKEKKKYRYRDDFRTRDRVLLLTERKLNLVGGDASMELTMAAQDDSSPWEMPSSSPSTGQDKKTTPPSPSRPLPGRAFFSKLGAVRYKPGRGDAPPTLSKSCSDKLALRQCTSLLSSVTSLLVSPARVYLRSLVLPESRRSPAACSRAFSPQGRMAAVAAKAAAAAATSATWPGGGGAYAFTPFDVTTTAREFAFSKRSAAAAAAAAAAARRLDDEDARTAASHAAVAWSRHGLEETLAGGVLQGCMQFEVRGASAVSRRRLWRLALDVAETLSSGGAASGDADEEAMSEEAVGEEAVGEAVKRSLRASTYHDVKQGELLAQRTAVKEDVKATALQGWVQNEGDSVFGLEEGHRV